MVTWATPGAKCVCIQEYRYENDLQREFAPNLPKKGRPYPIRTVSICPMAGSICLTFEGLLNKEYRDLGEVGFNADGFRPVVTRMLEQDVALFTPALADARTEERV